MKTKRSNKPPTPAQLAARKRFAEMARSGAFKRKAQAARKKNSAQKIRAEHADVFIHNSRGFSGRAPSWTKLPVKKKGTKRAKNPLRFKSEKEYQAWKARTGPAPRRKASKSGGFKRTAKAVGRNIIRGLGMAHNPQGQHLPGLPAKYQRMYEDILSSAKESGRYKGREKEVAARTVRAAVKRENPSLFGRLFARRKLKVTGRGKTQRGHRKITSVGYRKTQRGQFRPTGYMERMSQKRTRSKLLNPKKPSAAQRRARAFERARRQKIVAYRQRGRVNPSPATVFSEFRGKNVATKTKARAAKGTPGTLAKLGGLQELHVRGKRLHFNGGCSLAADGRKKLHIVGARFAKPNPPGEVDYGEILSVVYRADKPHIEEGVFDYKHHFGEDGGKRPHLIVDQEGYPIIEGGDYKITSDGIID